ncbi:hypothetical protein PIB30_054622 [Stylosanthes scabra]|uniref:Uncharacterized protein n=1 Tax=Stylosanthes scabra TaxID=79078 RepID=A0ABU6TJ81_9FABA|nr:hypothetical protein [Stylosanthes scabra]
MNLSFVRDHVAKVGVIIKHVPGCVQLADILTKAVSSTLFTDFRSKLRISACQVLSLSGDVRDIESAPPLPSIMKPPPRLPPSLSFPFFITTIALSSHQHNSHRDPFSLSSPPHLDRNSRSKELTPPIRRLETDLKWWHKAERLLSFMLLDSAMMEDGGGPPCATISVSRDSLFPSMTSLMVAASVRGSP